MQITTHVDCRSCGSKLPSVAVLDLGFQAVVDFPLIGEFSEKGQAPLQLVKCPYCQLVQLRHSVDADTLYRQFWYRSGVNEQMRMALADVVDYAKKLVELKDGDVVCDIGTNDGTLLSYYPDGVRRFGFEPAYQLAAEAKLLIKDGTIINDFFKRDYMQPTSCKIITAVAMFYDLDNPKEFLQDVANILHPCGVFIVQMNYLGMMLKNCTFDNISHEHVCYYSLASLEELFRSVGLRIVDVEMNDVNGGSMRVAAAFAPAVEQKSVEWMRNYDQSMCSKQKLLAFNDRVKDICMELSRFVKALYDSNKKVFVYGASTRGLSLLQTVFGCEDARKYFAGAAERDGHKHGHYMSGVEIPIVSEEHARQYADYFFLLPYHFWPSIRKREWAWMEAGGKFIIPLPYPRVMLMSRFSSTEQPVPITFEDDLQRVAQ